MIIRLVSMDTMCLAKFSLSIYTENSDLLSSLHPTAVFVLPTRQQNNICLLSLCALIGKVMLDLRNEAQNNISTANEKIAYRKGLVENRDHQNNL